MDASDRELAMLDEGMRVTHSPNPVKAQAGGRSGQRYTWLYTTTVQSSAGPLTLEEFGAFVWHDGGWVFSTYTGKPFTPADFAEWYACPGARMEAGRAYCDPLNWVGAAALRTGKTRWYFIARDAGGRRVKGEGVVEELTDLARA